MGVWQIIATVFGTVITAIIAAVALVRLSDNRLGRLEGRIDRLEQRIDEAETSLMKKIDATTASLSEAREEVAFIRGRMSNVVADPQLPSGTGP